MAIHLVKLAYAICLAGIAGFALPHFSSADGKSTSLHGKNGMSGDYAHVTIGDTVRRVVNHPAFAGFGPLLLPWNDNRRYLDTPLSNVGSLMPYHDHVAPELVVCSINHMIDAAKSGQIIFYDFYTKRQRQEDPAKIATGLFLFRGKPGAPFAVVCPGGGFSYVGSLHEGFPVAMALSKKGYNAFVLKYRTGSGLHATQDLAAALSHIFENTKLLEVSAEKYSLWGGSAGARMVGDIALKGTAYFGGRGLPKPCIVVIAYTGQTTFSQNFPPAFITVSDDDGIVDVSTVDQRVTNLRSAGVEVEYRKYKNAGHGFGLGAGTDAEEWLEHATGFWTKHIKQN